MARRFLGIVAVALAALTLALGAAALLAPRVPGCSERYLCRWLGWRASDVGDLARFPAASVPAPEGARPTPVAPAVPEPVLALGGERVPLGALLERSGTLAFLVDRGGAIVWEWYAPGYDRTATVTSFSVAKSVASLLLERLARPLPEALDTPVVAFVPELLEIDPGYAELTLAQLASMRSGIRYRDHDLPWGDKPLSYYHPELRRLALELPLADEPGAEFEYNTWNTVLLGVALERLGSAPIAELTARELWRPLGAEADASWSLDSERGGMAKMESGFNAAPVDFAKLGRLLLDGGLVGGERLLSEAYLARVLEPDPALRVGDGLHYQLGWWLHTDEDDKDGEPWAVAGWGHLGQYLYAFPAEDVVVVRFGRESGELGRHRAWGDALRRVAAAVGEAAQEDAAPAASSSPP